MNNRGITLTSLLIYVIGMSIALGTIATITAFFYKNVDINDINDDTTTQYTKFSSIFTEEINKENNYIVDCKTSTENTKLSYIIFASGNQYTYDSTNKSIYKNNIKICSKIEDCDFSYVFIDSKYTITVNFRTKSIDLTGDNAVIYTL